MNSCLRYDLLSISTALLSMLLASFPFGAKADAVGNFPGFAWATGAGGSGDDAANTTAVGPNGVIYVAGSFSGSATFGNVHLVSSAAHDIFIAAYNPDGHVLWATNADGTLESEARGIATDAAGNIFVTGAFRGSLPFGSTTINGGNFGSIFLAKYDSSGKPLWAKAAGGYYGAFGQACAVDKNGDAYVTGFFSGPASFWDGYTGNSTGFYAVFVMKVSGDGHIVWLNTFGDSSSDNWGLGVAVDANLNTFAAGQIGRHFYIAKYDSAGNRQWLKQPAVQNVPGAAVPSPVPDGNGGAYFACNIMGPSDFDGMPVTTVGGVDFVLGHYDLTGLSMWAKSFGGTGDDYVRSIAQDADGNLSAGGSFENTINFGTSSLNSSGGADILVSKFAPDGTFIWAARAGGVSEDTALCVAADRSGNVSLVGSFSGTAAFGTTSKSSSGGTDAFVARLAASPGVAKRPVIVIPGIMGTTLYATGIVPIVLPPPSDLVWVNDLAAVTSADDNFLRVLELADSGGSVYAIRPGPILDGTRDADFLNTYADLLKFLKTSGYVEDKLLFTFPYDWRLDNQLNAIALNDFIENVVVPASGQTKIDIVAHSMGGLLVRKYAQTFTENRLSKIIYLGTPHRGAPTSFGALAFSDAFVENFLALPAINSETLAEVARTCPSIFELLPRDPFIRSLKSHQLLGIKQCYQQSSQGGFLISSRWVSAADSFHESIVNPLSVPQFQIVGSAIPTLNQLLVVSELEQTPRTWAPGAGNGDGTVPIESASSAPGDNITTFYLNGIAHSDLPNASVSHVLILDILKGTFSSLPAGVSKQPFPLETVYFAWNSGSPVRVSIADSDNKVDAVSFDGSLRKEIPFSSFYTFEDNQGGFLTGDQPYQITVSATAYGMFALNFYEEDAIGAVIGSNTFVQVPVAPGSMGTFSLSPGTPNVTMALDIDGDGATDISITANQAIPPGVYTDILGFILKTCRLNAGMERSFQAKLVAAKLAIDRARIREAQNILSALRNEISAQTGKALTRDQAAGINDIIDYVILSF